MPDNARSGVGRRSVLHQYDSTMDHRPPLSGIYVASKFGNGIMMSRKGNYPIVKIRPPKWADNCFFIRTKNYLDAQFIADAVYYYIGRGPAHFCDAEFQYPPLCLDTCELLSRKNCFEYVLSIASGVAMKKQREEYRKRVEALVLETVESPKAVLFLRSLSPDVWLKSEKEISLNDAGSQQCELRHCSTSSAECYDIYRDFVEKDCHLELSSVVPVSESVIGVNSCILNNEEPARKRIWTRNWSAEEIRALLELMEEADGQGHDWDYVSENLWEKYGYDRASNSCEKLWGILLQSCRASCIRSDITAHVADFESCIGVVGTGYWRAPEILQALSEKKLLWKFDSEMSERVERIPTAKPETTSIQMDADWRFQSDMGRFRSAHWDHDHDSKIEESNPQSEDEGLSGDSTATVESQAGDVPRTNQSHQSSYETNTISAGRKRSASRALEDDLISRIAPFVNEQIEDALRPIISVLRNRKEEERKHREKMLALEEEKLALKREKMLFTHLVLANSSGFRAGLQLHHESKLGKGFI